MESCLLNSQTLPHPGKISKFPWHEWDLIVLSQESYRVVLKKIAFLTRVLHVCVNAAPNPVLDVSHVPINSF